MKVRSVDVNNDWNFGRAKNDYLEDTQATAQNIKTRLQMFLGDCFFALNQGIDWFNLLGSFNELELRLAMASTILNTKNVVQLKTLNVNINSDREISANYTVETVYGDVEGEL